MAVILDKIFPFTGVKRAVINWLLDSMAENTKYIVLGQILARQLPTMHLHKNPKRKQ